LRKFLPNLKNKVSFFGAKKFTKTKFAFQFGENTALEAFLGYNTFKFSDADDSINTFGLNIGVAAFIGGGSGDKK
jgi:hypothetical protein